MSDNAEFVRRGYERWNTERDPEGFIGLASPDFEWHPNPADPEQRVREGREEVMASLQDLLDAFESLTMEVRELIDAGDRVVAVVRHRATGRGSGAEVERDEVHVWTFRDGVPVRLDEFATREDALAAVETSA